MISRHLHSTGPAAASVFGYSEPLEIPLREALDIAELQGAVRAVCHAAGLGAEETFRSVVCASELAGAVFLRSAAGGRILLRLVRTPLSSGVEIEVEERGPAVKRAPQAGDPRRAEFADEARRLMDEFEVAGRPDGTRRITARLWARR